MNFWDEFQIENGSTLNCKIGNLSLWIEQRDEEYLIAPDYVDDDKAVASATMVENPGEVPENLSWNRYIVQEPSATFQLTPALPDRAVVVRPEFPIKLAPNSASVFYVSIPVWVQIRAGKKQNIMLMEIPSLVLSNTWFGDSMSGELCYALTTRAIKNIEEMSDVAHRIICPVHIQNSGSDLLDFQRLCIHVEHLRVYSGTHHLWSNEVTITYVGNEQPNEIGYEDRTPEYEKRCAILATERVPVQKSIIKRGFSFIKSFTSFD
jgi:hypothetical protein